MENAELLLPKARQEVSDEVIARIPDFRGALRLCKEISGLTDQQIAAELKIEAAQWSRIWTAQAHFPPEKIPQLMDLCGNWVPLRWLATYYGQDIRPKKTTLERELEVERQKTARLESEMAAIVKFMKEVRP